MAVSKEVEKKKQSRVALQVRIGGEQTADAYQKILKKYSKNAEIKGFRRGKIPTTVLESKFGKFMREESKAELLNETLTELWRDDPSIAPLAHADQDIDAEHELTPGTEYAFGVEYDVMPEVPLPDLSQYMIPSPRVDIGEEMVQEELQRIQQRNALAIDTNAPAQEGDVVSVDVALPCGHHHDRGEDEHAHDMPLVVKAGDESHPSGLGTRLLGLSVDQRLVLEGEDARTLCQRLHVEETEKVEIHCKKVQRHDLPEIDDEFAQDVGEEYQTLEDLKNAIRENLRERVRDFVSRYRIAEFYRAWLGSANVLLPQTLEKHARQRAVADLLEKDEGQRHDHRSKLAELTAEPTEEFNKAVRDCEQQIKVELLRGAIAKDQNISVSPDEFFAAADRMTQRMYRCSFQQFSEFAGERAGETLRSGLEERLLADKIDKYILETMGEREGEVVDFEQLREMASRSYIEQTGSAASSPD